ncbi:SDR family oxidoreductase [Candidatus Lokiarchaeum ossiferum]|uniref:SDR family oxidoreductase n=1 Tax=Candidatus Lokiarchaeum ossiferum TaxID=2951803 RepID=UPI00352D08A6
MNLLLQGKNILITGGSKGLGFACAKLIAEEGANIILASRSLKNLESAAKEIEKDIGIKPTIIQADLSQLESIQNLHAVIMSKFEKIDGIILNAGGPPPGMLLDHDDEVWQSAINTNLLSVIRICKLFVPSMQAQNYGRIVAITSVSAKQPLDRLGLSNTTRIGVIGYLKTLSNEISKNNVLINTLLPGPTRTERLIKLNENKARLTGRSIHEVEQDWIQNIPIGRLGEPEEFAPLAAYLISGRNTYITGQEIAIDGGFVKSAL